MCVVQDYRAGLIYLKALEDSPQGLTTDELQYALGLAGLEMPSLRTVQRDLKLLSSRKLKFHRQGKKIFSVLMTKIWAPFSNSCVIFF